jgi:rfaE bifunctional protein kinase chain/domain
MTPSEDLHISEAADRLAGARVLAVGDLILDEYLWGEVTRISPEAPVPVVDVRGRTLVPGGAANVATGIVALGGTALLGGVIGADAHGEQLKRALAERRVDCGGIVIDASRATTTKTRVIAHSQQVVRADAEQRGPLTPELEDALLEWAAAQVSSVDALVISDYAKGVVSARVAQGLIQLARTDDTPVVVDPKGTDYTKYAGATFLTPNVHEAERAANIVVERAEDLQELGRRLGTMSPGSLFLITRGAEGMTLASPSGSLHVKAAAHEVYDVTGAGDTVAAILGVALARGLSAETAVSLANAGAGIVVSKVGTATVTLDELRTLQPAAATDRDERPPARRLDRPSPS